MTRYRHVVEIGAGDSHSSVAWPMSTHADKVTMWEANTLLWADLARATSGLDHITVRPYAVSDVGGNYPLYHLGYASYLAGDPSFFATSIDAGSDEVLRPLLRMVPVATVNQAVTPDVDYLILTIGGGEARLLRAMIPRPKTIQTKHMCHNARHWEEFAKVCTWMQTNGYVGRRLSTCLHDTLQHIAWTLDTAPQPA